MVAHLHAGAEEVPIGEVQDSRWLRETKEECAGKDVFLLEIAKGRALDGSAPFDSEGGYVVVKLEFVKCFVLSLLRIFCKEGLSVIE